MSRFWKASGNALLPGSAVLVSSAAAWTPASLGSALVAWYDFSDLSTLFQDDAGTTAVTASGQSIGKILDKSGNARHLTQSTAANKPVYTTGSGLAWGAFDGTNDTLASSSGQTVTDGSGQHSSGAAIMFNTTVGDRSVIGCELLGSVFRLRQTSGNISVLDWSTPTEDLGAAVVTATAKTLTEISSTSAIEVFMNGVGNGSTATGTLSTSTTTICLGGTNPSNEFHNGNIYAAALFNRPLTAGEHASFVTYLGSKCGLSL